MTNSYKRGMARATALTRTGKLQEATALIQSLLQSQSAGSADAGQGAVIEGDKNLGKGRGAGDGISFDENKSPTNNNNTGVDKTLSLPKSGKLRLVMDDGTVQEINLARVREATVKP